MITITCAATGTEAEFENENAAYSAGWGHNNETNAWFSPRSWFRCNDCEGVWSIDCRIQDDNGTEICRECYNGEWTRCEHCERLIRSEDTYTIYTHYNNGRSGEEYWCENCRDEDAEWNDDEDCEEWWEPSPNNGRLPSCLMGMREIYEQVVPEEVRRMNDQDKNKWFKTHLFPYDRNITCYHDNYHSSFKSLMLKTEHENPYLYYGFELELLFNSHEPIENIVRTLLDPEIGGGLFVAEFDRSVSNLGCGAEFITRPMSFKAFMGEEVQTKLKKFLTKAKELGAYNTQPDGCGLHVHTSKKFYEQNIKKPISSIKGDLDWMFQIFQPEIEKISRRKYTEYCASKAIRIQRALRNTEYFFNTKIKLELEKGEEVTLSRGSGITHHDAVIQTSRTIEYRTFRSTVNQEVINATIEFCRAMAHAARNMNIQEGKTCFGDILFCKDSQFLPTLVKKQKVNLKTAWVNSIKIDANGRQEEVPSLEELARIMAERRMYNATNETQNLTEPF